VARSLQSWYLAEAGILDGLPSDDLLAASMAAIVASTPSREVDCRAGDELSFPLARRTLSSPSSNTPRSPVCASRRGRRAQFGFRVVPYRAEGIEGLDHNLTASPWPVVQASGPIVRIP